MVRRGRRSFRLTLDRSMAILATFHRLSSSRHPDGCPLDLLEALFPGGWRTVLGASLAVFHLACLPLAVCITGSDPQSTQRSDVTMMILRCSYRLLRRVILDPIQQLLITAAPTFLTCRRILVMFRRMDRVAHRLRNISSLFRRPCQLHLRLDRVPSSSLLRSQA